MDEKRLDGGVDFSELELAMQLTLQRWPEVDDSGKVFTCDFLQCSNLVVQFIESLGIAFTPVSRDVQGNITKLMANYLTDRERFKFIQDMIVDGTAPQSYKAREALMWLRRGLLFLCVLLESLIDDFEKGVESESIASNLKRSYESTLSVYHNFILRQLFNLLCQASPSRTQLMQRLSIIANNADRNIFMQEIKVFQQGLRTNLDAIGAFYASQGFQQ